MRSIFIFFICLMLFSCKKDKLEGESEILLGTWKWSYTYKTSYICAPPEVYDTLNPQTENQDYSIEWTKNSIAFRKNNAVCEEGWFQLEFISPPNLLSGYSYSFTAYLKGDYDNHLNGIVGEDTMMVNTKFPFSKTNCESYSSYFVRQ